ncbi:phage antirepressor KilAC domain-containing protein [Spartinivicinus marinus]|uniref:phage antirepressor KilAC domain-containing protein n=1 Tax=Spartinivicinus marinus TaxID=2994442 RepID=UPI003369EA53
MEEALPKVEFYDKVTHATDAISVGKSAKILNTGRNRLMSYLRRHEWVNSDNEPYQVMIELGYMDVKLGKYYDPEHGLTESITPLITGKGLAKLRHMRAMH